MKQVRVALALLAIGSVAACGEPAPAEITAPEEITAPAALAASGGGNAISKTICSGPGTELSYDGSAWIPAFHTEPQGAYGATLDGSSWVAPLFNSGITSAPAGTYYFRTIFSLPADAKAVKLEGAVHADNQAIFFLNGTQFFQQAVVLSYANFQSPEDPFSTHSGFVAGGVNTVGVNLVNGADSGDLPSAAALDFCYTVSYQSATEGGGGGGGGSDGAKGCPAAPAVAAHILHGLGVQPNSAAGRNIIALVGQHMTQGAKFDGFDKCDPRYAAAVAAFVAPLVAGSE